MSLAHQGRIGVPQMALLRSVIPYSRYLQLRHRETAVSGGALNDKGSHHFDVLNWIAEVPTVSVAAMGGRSGVFAPDPTAPARCSECSRACPDRRHETLIDNAEGVDRVPNASWLTATAPQDRNDTCVFLPVSDIADHAVVTVRYANRLVACLFFDILGPYAPDQEKLESVGSFGRLRMDRHSGSIDLVAGHGKTHQAMAPDMPDRGSSHFRADLQLVRSLRRFVDGTAPTVGVPDGIASLRMVLAAQVASGAQPACQPGSGGLGMICAPLPPAPDAARGRTGAGAALWRHPQPFRSVLRAWPVCRCSGARGINWAAFDARLSPFVEMLSMHGCAETSESDRGYLHSIGPVDGHSTMAHGLALGKVFGIVANTDHHSAWPGSYGHGRMVAYARGRNREAIWQSFLDRRTNALTGDKIHLLATVDDVVQGGILSRTKDAAPRIEGVAGGFIDSINVIRDGRLWHRISPEITPAPLSDSPETVLKLELGWGARRTSQHWQGTLRIEGGEILSAEPRFRGADVVSPLELQDGGAALPVLEQDGAGLRFADTAEANPNNFTSATQGIALRLRLDPGAVIRSRLSGQDVPIPAARLLEGAKSGNLGP